MKSKRLLSGLIALGMVVSAFPGMVLNAGAEGADTTGLETGVYIGSASLAAEKYLHSDGTVCTDTEHEHDYDDDACNAYMAAGELTLWGNLDITEAQYAGEKEVWGGISGVVGNASMKITLRPGADITINSGHYSGIYGNYEPIYIQGDGKISINTSGSSAGGLLQYGNYKFGDDGITITDGADVSITGTAGVAMLSTEGAGDITVTDGATLTVDVSGKSFSKDPVIQDGSTVTVGADSENTAAWDGETSLTTYKYVKIEAPAAPEPVVTPAPTLEPTPEPSEEPSSVDNPTDWVGVQTEKGGKTDWYYNNHYMMPDGECYTSPNNPYHGFVKGMETMYYTADDGVLEFNRDVTLYGIEENLSTYYGVGIAANGAKPDLIIRLNNNANVTIDATDRGTYAYLYGLYSTGDLIIEGNGTLTIKSDGGTSDNAALCIYNGTWNAPANLTVKDNVKLILENTDANGYGIHAYGTYVGDVTIEDNAYVEMTGGQAAISKAPVIKGEQKVYAGSSASETQVLSDLTNIASYKYVRIAADGVTADPVPSAENSEAAINGTSAVPVRYATLEEAVEKAGAEIALLKDSSVGEIKSNTLVSIDLNGKTLSADNGEAININCYVVNITNGTIDGNINVSGTCNINADVTGNITVNNNSTINISGGSFKGTLKENEGGNIIISGGTFNSDPTEYLAVASAEDESQNAFCKVDGNVYTVDSGTISAEGTYKSRIQNGTYEQMGVFKFNNPSGSVTFNVNSDKVQMFIPDVAAETMIGLIVTDIPQDAKVSISAE